MKQEKEESDEIQEETANSLEWAIDSTKFDNVYHPKDPNDQKNWRDRIGREFEDIKKREVWERMKKLALLEGVTLHGSK